MATRKKTAAKKKSTKKSAARAKKKVTKKAVKRPAARKGAARDVGVDADARGGIGERGVTEPVERRRGGNQRRERGANFVEGRVGGQDRGHERQIGRAARFGNRAGTTMSTRTFFAVI